jgi:hemolysin activation/secretion protein
MQSISLLEKCLGRVGLYKSAATKDYCPVNTFGQFFLVMISVLLMLTVCWADQNAQNPKFHISKFVVTGNSKVSTETINAVVAEFIGDDRDFSSIQSAVSAIKKTYLEDGYETIRIVVPKQELENGIVHLQVIEAQLGKIEVQGNKFYDGENIRHALHSLKEGEIPNINDLATDLRLSNESNAKQTQVTFRVGDDPKKVNAVANVVDDKQWHAAVSLDNTGTDQTGNFRTGVAFMHANILNLDHVLSGQFVTSPDRVGDVQIFGMNYRIPLYALGDELEFNGSHSNVNSGVVNTTAGSYGISGSGDSFGTRYIHLLPRIHEYDHRVNFGFDYRVYSNNVSLVGSNSGSLIPDVEIHPLSMNYTGLLKQQERDFSVSAGLYQNVPGGAIGDNSRFQAVRSGAVADYTLVRYALSFNQNLPMNWRFHSEFNGQLTNDALVSGEQFGIGGINSVRGFQERTQSNDKGLRGAVEVYTPDFGNVFEFMPLNLKALVFYNFANAWRNYALPGEIKHDHLSSVGIGFRGNVTNHLLLRLDMADILDTGGVTTVGQKHYQASIIYIY